MVDRRDRELSLLLDHSPDFIFKSRIDDFRFVEVNQSACDQYGFTRDEFLKMDIFDIEIDPPLKEQVRALYETTPVGKVVEVFGTNRKKDGSAFPVHVRFLKLDEEFALANVRDISVQKEAEERLLASEKQLGDRIIEELKRSARLQKDLLEVADNERQRISRDLHDGLGQDLTGISFYSKALSNELSDQYPKLLQMSQAITEHVDKALDRTRKLVRGLSPLEHGETDLKHVLEALSFRVESVYGLKTSCQISESIHIKNVDVLSQIYLIAQEAVLNAVKHSGGDQIEIALQTDADQVCMSISDNGRGLETSGPPSEESMGLRIMRHRVEVIKGKLSFMEQEGGGTRIEVIFKQP